MATGVACQKGEAVLFTHFSQLHRVIQFRQRFSPSFDRQQSVLARTNNLVAPTRGHP